MSAEKFARLLLTEWLGRTDRTVLSDICVEHGRDASALTPVFSMYEFACVYLVLGSRSRQSPLFDEVISHFTMAIQSQMSDRSVVEELGSRIQDVGTRLASLLEGADRDRPLRWAQESLRDDFAIDEANPVTLTMWAHYWMDYYVHLSRACEDIGLAQG